MKTIETLTYNGFNLSVLVTVDNFDKATVEYFINGMEIGEWATIKHEFQLLFTSLVDITCKKLGATKWAY